MVQKSSVPTFKDTLINLKITDENRDQLFVEVNQEELIENIFHPLRDLARHDSHFFPNRFAILGDYKAGKTELGKFIIDKLKRHYQECIYITINSKMVQDKNVEEVDEWIFNQWFKEIPYFPKPEFQTIVDKKAKEFRDRHHADPKDCSDKIHFICDVYREYLKAKPNVRYIIEFDQANLIATESQFTPFYEFWRNFQGYWENNAYFQDLPIFIFVIGHKNWIEFAQLKDSIGRGVFDKIFIYNYWNTNDLHQLFEKRLKFTIPPENWAKYLGYFLCNGVVEFFAKKLNDASTQEYLDQFFGVYMQDFFKDFQNNFKKYPDFLTYCKQEIREQKSDDTYFSDIERVFIGTPAMDFMPVFRFLSDNQDVKWFDELFNLMQNIFEEKSVSLESKDFRQYRNLGFDFIFTNFTHSPLEGGMNPNYLPPLFTNYQKKLMFSDIFQRCIEVIQNRDKRGPIYMLKRFIKSKRIQRNRYLESDHGKLLEFHTKQINQIISEIMEIIQKWSINKAKGIITEKEETDEGIISPFQTLKSKLFDLSQNFQHENTNWAIFDEKGREIANSIIEHTVPKNSIFYKNIDFAILKEIRDKITSTTSSNIVITEELVKLLTAFKNQIQSFDTKKFPKKPQPEGANMRTAINESQGKQWENVLLIIDGPNSLGEEYQDQLDLEATVKYAQSFNKNADLKYLTRSDEIFVPHDYITRLGFDLQLSHKDIDQKLIKIIEERMNSKNPPDLIILGVKDFDYIDIIKRIRSEFKVKVLLAVSSKTGLSKALKLIFEERDIKYFPKRLENKFKINPPAKNEQRKPNIVEKLNDNFKSAEPKKLETQEIHVTANVKNLGSDVMDEQPLHAHENPVQTIELDFTKSFRDRLIGTAVDGKQCIVAEGSTNQPKLGEKWLCSIKLITDANYFVNPIKKVIKKIEAKKALNEPESNHLKQISNRTNEKKIETPPSHPIPSKEVPKLSSQNSSDQTITSKNPRIENQTNQKHTEQGHIESHITEQNKTIKLNSPIKPSPTTKSKEKSAENLQNELNEINTKNTQFKSLLKPDQAVIKEQPIQNEKIILEKPKLLTPLASQDKSLTTLPNPASVVHSSSPDSIASATSPFKELTYEELKAQSKRALKLSKIKRQKTNK